MTKKQGTSGRVRVPTAADYGCLRLRIGALVPDRGYPVDSRLRFEGREQTFERGHLDGAFLPFGEAESPRADGERIFEWLYADRQVAAAWLRATTLAPNCRVVLEIDPQASEVAAVPFEQLRLVSGRSSRMMAADVATPLVRLVPCHRSPAPPVQSGPFRMLVAISSPTDLVDYGLEAIDARAERAWIQGLQTKVGRRSLELSFLEQATLLDIERDLDGQHGLLLVCHGVFSERQQQGALFLCDGGERVARVPNSLFAELIDRRGSSLRLIHLSSCQSADRGGFSSLAPQLVAVGTPAVLGMRGQVPMRSASLFAAGFYRELLISGDVARASAAGRADLLTRRAPGAELPTLYVGGDNTQILADPPGLRVSWREKAWGLAGVGIGKLVGRERAVTPRQTLAGYASVLFSILLLVVVAIGLDRLLGAPKAMSLDPCVEGRVVLEGGTAGVEGAPMLGGWTIEALSGDGSVAVATTEADGSYVLCTPTRYLLRAVPPTAYRGELPAFEKNLDLKDGGRRIDFAISFPRSLVGQGAPPPGGNRVPAPNASGSPPQSTSASATVAATAAEAPASGVSPTPEKGSESPGAAAPQSSTLPTPSSTDPPPSSAVASHAAPQQPPVPEPKPEKPESETAALFAAQPTPKSEQPTVAELTCSDSPPRGVDCDWGSLPRAVYDFFVNVVNSCPEEQTVVVDSETSWIRFEGPTKLERIPAGLSQAAAAQIDLRELRPGAHRGKIKFDCANCKATKCKIRRKLTYRIFVEG